MVSGPPALSLREQQQKLNEKLRGHYAYYGVTGNSAALSRFLHGSRIAGGSGFTAATGSAR